jgi:hypothetical protein
VVNAETFRGEVRGSFPSVRYIAHCSTKATKKQGVAAKKGRNRRVREREDTHEASQAWAERQALSSAVQWGSGS